MRSFIPIVVGVLCGLCWILYYSSTALFSADADFYGLEITGLCIGGPALAIMIIGTFISMLLEDSK